MSHPTTKPYFQASKASRKQVRATNTPLHLTFIKSNWGLQGYTIFSYFRPKTQTGDTRQNRLTEAALTCTHNQCSEQKQEKYIYIKKKKKKKKKKNLKMNTFTAEKYCCILHGRVLVMWRDYTIGVWKKQSRPSAARPPCS